MNSKKAYRKSELESKTKPSNTVILYKAISSFWTNKVHDDTTSTHKLTLYNPFPIIQKITKKDRQNVAHKALLYIPKDSNCRIHMVWNTGYNFACSSQHKGPVEDEG